jgi:hypothetical protein
VQFSKVLAPNLWGWLAHFWGSRRIVPWAALITAAGFLALWLAHGNFLALLLITLTFLLLLGGDTAFGGRHHHGLGTTTWHCLWTHSTLGLPRIYRPVTGHGRVDRPLGVDRVFAWHRHFSGGCMVGQPLFAL